MRAKSQEEEDVSVVRDEEMRGKGDEERVRDEVVFMNEWRSREGRSSQVGKELSKSGSYFEIGALRALDGE